MLFAGFEAPLSLWDSYGLAGYGLGAGSICADARGRWYINICGKVKKPPQIRLECLGNKPLISNLDPPVTVVVSVIGTRDERP